MNNVWIIDIVTVLLSMAILVIPFIYVIKVKSDKKNFQNSITKYGIILLLFSILSIVLDFYRVKKHGRELTIRLNKQTELKDSIILNQEKQINYLNRLIDFQDNLNKGISRLNNLNDEIDKKASVLNEEILKSNLAIKKLENPISQNLQVSLKHKISISHVNSNLSPPEVNNLISELKSKKADFFKDQFFQLFSGVNISLNFISEEFNYLPKVKFESGNLNFLDGKIQEFPNSSIKFYLTDSILHIRIDEIPMQHFTNSANLTSFNDLCGKNLEVSLWLRPKKNYREHKTLYKNNTIFTIERIDNELDVILKDPTGRKMELIKMNTGFPNRPQFFGYPKKENCWNENYYNIW